MGPVAIRGTIELRNDDDRFNVKHNGGCLNLESRNLVPGDLKKLSSLRIDHQNNHARKTEVQ